LITSKPNCPVPGELPHNAGVERENYKPYPENVSRQSDSFFSGCKIFIEEIWPPSDLSKFNELLKSAEQTKKEWA
jgi:hypothetical protein